MKDILPALDRWHAAGKRAAIATVTRVWGSSPRPAGARMAVAEGGDFVGSVSAGCVEADVFDEAERVIASGLPTLRHFGISDEQALNVGLSCGGEIDVWIEPDWTADPASARLATELRRCLDEERDACLVTLVQESSPARHALLLRDGVRVGSLGVDALDAAAATRAPALLDTGVAESVEQGLPGGATARLFFDPYPAPPSLVIFGGTQIAIPLVSFAKRCGFRVTVVDGRPRFAVAARFAEADRVLLAWPEEAAEQVRIDGSTYVAVLNHDPKFDEPAIKVALSRGARYVGAIGSRRTRAQHTARLREQGVPEADLERIHGPIGLDIGARTPEETAISILAEIIAERYGRTGGMLSRLGGA